MKFDSSQRDGVTFEAFYVDNYHDIYAYVRRRIGVRSDVSDVVSDVFTTAWRRRRDVPPSPHDRLWLFGVARNVVRNHQRHELGWRNFVTGPENGLHSLTGDDESSSDTLTPVQRALGALRTSDQEILALIYWDGLSHEEVAFVLGVSTNAVALRAKKAKDRLRDVLVSIATPLPTSTNTPEVFTIHKEHTA